MPADMAAPPSFAAQGSRSQLSYSVWRFQLPFSAPGVRNGDQYPYQQEPPQRAATTESSEP